MAEFISELEPADEAVAQLIILGGLVMTGEAFPEAVDGVGEGCEVEGYQEGGIRGCPGWGEGVREAKTGA